MSFASDRSRVLERASLGTVLKGNVMTRARTWTVIIFGVLWLVGPARAQSVQVEDVGIRLFYETSGTLSEDITKQKEFHLWNTLIGEGDAKEPASSFLITVTLSGKPESFRKRAVVTVTIRDANSQARVPTVHRIKNLVFGRTGRLVKAVWVENRVCSPLIISAAVQHSSRTIHVPFSCGE